MLEEHDGARTNGATRAGLTDENPGEGGGWASQRHECRRQTDGGSNPGTPSGDSHAGSISRPADPFGRSADACDTGAIQVSRQGQRMTIGRAPPGQ
jgi:hypothetical protein